MVHRRDLPRFRTSAPQEGAARVRMNTGGSIFQQFARAGRATGYYRSYQGTRQYDQLQIRNLTLQDSMGARLVDAIVLAAVPGSGVVFNWGPPYSQKLWDKWRWNSINRHADIITLQRLLVRGMVRDGETFLTGRMGRAGNLYLDARSPATIKTDSGIWNVQGGMWKQGGILFDDDLVPAWYDFTAPGTDLLYQPTNALPAVYPGELVAHVFSQDFEWQTRGLSWLLPALSALEEYADNVQDLSKIIKLLGEMSYAVILDNEYVPDDAVETEVEGETRYARIERFINTGARQLGVLPPGAKIQEYPPPPAVQAGLTDVVKFHEARLARAVGVSQHTLSGSQSEANLSSIRAGEAQNQMVYERAQHITTLGMERVGQIFWEHYALADRQFRREVPYYEPEIIPPGSQGIDYRDRQVDLAEVKEGLTPRGQIWRKRGLNPAEMLAEILAEREALGMNQAAPGEEVPDPEEEPDGTTGGN